MKDTHKTKVIFRKFQNEIIAIFPEITVGSNVNHCMSYEHDGQHSACDIGILEDSIAVTEDEYAFLKSELENIVGYNLEIVEKYSSIFTETRKKELYPTPEEKKESGVSDIISDMDKILNNAYNYSFSQVLNAIDKWKKQLSDLS